MAKKNETENFKIELTDPSKKKEKLEVLSHPIKAVDLNVSKSISELVDSFKNMSIQARNIGKCAEVLDHMLTDPDRPTVMLGLAGPLIAAGLRKTIRDMVAYGMVDVIVSTGAVLYQDIYQARGFSHFKGTAEADDRKLRDLYIDRIYDTYLDEEKVWETDCWIGQFADTLTPGHYSSRDFLSRLGSTLDDDESIVATAVKRGVPIFAPAINDSSIGIGLTEHYHRCVTTGRAGVSIDSIRDNYELTQIAVKSKKTAAIYVAGGVPKNYINDSVVMGYIFGKDSGGHSYALQVTTDAPHWGGLSGSTLDEATSWGKINKKADKAMAFVEPSVSLPLLVGYSLQKKLAQNRKPLIYKWDNHILNSLEVSV
ncbi:MAG: deoxyhypusine synthase family protein [Deltaproteobacteria bacterium]|nr:MAG: deoxyhypusine synthase family protein [Deltaproteobacteria bacterium]